MAQAAGDNAGVYFVPAFVGLGAACLAGLGAGFWSGPDEIRRFWSLGRKFAPSMKEERARRLYQGWQEAVRKTLA
jgi:glycerol kinase